LGEQATRAFLDALSFARGSIEARHRDVGQAEHHTFGLVLALRASGFVLGAREHRLDHARWHRGRIAGTLEPERGLHGEPFARRDIVDRASCLELVDDLGSLRPETLGDLILVPFLLDARAHLVEVALTRRLDTRDLE